MRHCAVLWVSILLAGQSLAQQQVEVFEASIPELQQAMSSGRVTSVELVEAYLARIAAYDRAGPQLNSLIRVNPRAREEAAALDRERARSGPRGPLHGIPVILKDNFDTYDLPTTAGSIALASSKPPDDAFVVRKLREAGAVILGKANMHELAAGITTVSSLGGQTRNPYDPRRCPGGSSGGTGAAIAASFAAVGWGSDTCGSIRIPAAFGSLYGLRPTQGLVSRDGIIPLSHTQDIGGPLARTVVDLAIALDATIGYDPADPATSVLQGREPLHFQAALDAGALQGARLGVLENYFTDTDPEVDSVIRAALDSMRSLGAEIVPLRIPGLDSLLAGSRAVDFETKFDLIDYLARVPDAPVRSVAEILEKGLYHSALEERVRRIERASEGDSLEYRKALAKQAMIRDILVSILEHQRLDALVYPTMRQKPALIGERQTGSTCQLAAHTGLPALSAPAGFTPDGLPVGVELLGKPFSDARLLALAYSFERAGPQRRPPTTTPPLVNGRAPEPKSFTVSASGGALSTSARFRFDPLTDRLEYDVRVRGVPAEQIQAVALRRMDDSAPGPLTHRLSPPGAERARGVIELNGAERSLLLEGRLALVVFTTAQPAGAALALLRVP
ncbi:MAG: amidase [Gemmatimonadales bacterium]|nr:MAG: amidase [Gemmatimonadales bacterium]